MPFLTEGSTFEREMRDYDVQIEKGSDKVQKNYKWATREATDRIPANYNLPPVAH